MGVDSLSYSTISSQGTTNNGGQQNNAMEIDPPAHDMAAAAQAMSQPLVNPQGLTAGLQRPNNSQAIVNTPDDLAAATALLNLGQLSATAIPRQPQVQPPTMHQAIPPTSHDNASAPQEPDVFIDVPDDMSTSSIVSDLTHPRYSRTLIDKEDNEPKSPSP